MKNTKLSLALAGLLALSTSSFADDTADIAELKQQVKDLQEMTQTLTDETRIAFGVYNELLGGK